MRRYLETLREHRPKRGRPRTPGSIHEQLTQIETKLQDASPVEELALVQQRRDLTAELDAITSKADLTDLENDFVAVAKSYGERKGIAYATWREVGVPAAVLKRAGIDRGT